MTDTMTATMTAPVSADLSLPRPRRYGFNGATRLLNINGDRERFHRWCGRFVNLGRAYTPGAWQFYYDAFVAYEDARDLDDTQQDALR
jgi:hypothetical protein